MGSLCKRLSRSTPCSLFYVPFASPRRGLADQIFVNSRFTAGVFAAAFPLLLGAKTFTEQAFHEQFPHVPSASGCVAQAQVLVRRLPRRVRALDLKCKWAISALLLCNELGREALPACSKRTLKRAVVIRTR